MAKMSDYPSVDNTEEFTQEQKAAFLGSAMCIATGSKTAGGSKVTANIPLSDITPAVPTKLSDLTDDITVDTYDATSEAPISGKGVNAALVNSTGTALAYDISSGGICVKYDAERALDVDHDKLGVSFDDSTIVMGDDGLEVAVPVPDNTTGEGEILCWQSGGQGIEPHAVWCSTSNDIVVDTTNGDIRLAVPVPDPNGSPAANDGDVLTYDAQADEIVWAAPQGGTSIPTNPAIPAIHSGGETFVLGITLEKDTSGPEPTYYWSDLKWISK